MPPEALSCTRERPTGADILRSQPDTETRLARMVEANERDLWPPVRDAFAWIRRQVAELVPDMEEASEIIDGAEAALSNPQGFLEALYQEILSAVGEAQAVVADIKARYEAHGLSRDTGKAIAVQGLPLLVGALWAGKFKAFLRWLAGAAKLGGKMERGPKPAESGAQPADQLPDTKGVFRFEGKTAKPRQANNALQGERPSKRTTEQTLESVARGIDRINDPLSAEMLERRGNKWIEARLKNILNIADYVEKSHTYGLNENELIDTKKFLSWEVRETVDEILAHAKHYTVTVDKNNWRIVALILSKIK